MPLPTPSEIRSSANNNTKMNTKMNYTSEEIQKLADRTLHLLPKMRASKTRYERDIIDITLPKIVWFASPHRHAENVERCLSQGLLSRLCDSDLRRLEDGISRAEIKYVRAA